MRKRLNDSEKAKSVPVSLNPADRKFANQRCKHAGGNLSRYIQLLLAYDRAHNILPDALTLGLEKKEAA